MNECCLGLCAASVTVWAQHLYSTLFNMYVYFFSYWSFAQNSIVPYKTTFPRLPRSRRFLSLSCNWRDTSRSQLRISGEVLPFCSCSPSLALLLPIKKDVGQRAQQVPSDSTADVKLMEPCSGPVRKQALWWRSVFMGEPLQGTLPGAQFLHHPPSMGLCRFKDSFAFPTEGRRRDRS